MGRHSAVKDTETCPICDRTFYSKGIANHMKVHKQQPNTKETETMFTIDVVALITRLSNLEAECQDLRASLKAKEKEIYERIDEVQDTVFDQIPKLKDDRLTIETSDDKGNTVYAEVKTEQIIQAEAEQ